VEGANRDADEGVLEMKCPAVMLSYHNRPDVPLPLNPGRLLCDRRRVPARPPRLHYFVGRTDDMFVSGGENIYPTTSSVCWSAIPTSPRPAWYDRG